MKKYYITTPIYYPSGRLHLGHAYTTIAGDVLKKYKAQQGYDVFYLTGTDEHGEKIEKTAKDLNMEPKEYLDGFVDSIKSMWELLEIDYDYFIRTTDESHKKQVSVIFDRLLKNGDIYKGEYEGLYCVPCESYFTESQLVDGKCPDCGREVNVVKEESYFFKCSKYTDRLVEYFENNDDFLLPVSRKNELINNFIKPGLQDLAVSRTSFNWGIPVPNDEGHVIYVWIDALSNYITALNMLEDNSELKDFWPADVHLLGKEIVRFHAIYWPMILMALDLPLPKKLFAHGWLLMENDKMSKSKGNVIYPEFLVENYGIDAVKYYLMREIPFGDDGYFSSKNFISRFNNDLANDLGNLVNRTLKMVHQYCGGTVNNKNLVVNEIEIKTLYAEAFEKYNSNMEEMNFARALASVWEIVSRSNKYIDQTSPWVLAKDETKKDELEQVLYNLLHLIELVSYCVYPFLTNTSKEIQRQLGVEVNAEYDKYKQLSSFTVSEEYGVLFMRLDVDVEVEKINESIFGKKVEEKERITFDEFQKVNIVCGKVLSCVQHPKADKLLLFKVSLGYKEVQIVSGIANFYSPEDLVGKKLAVVENLKPTKIRGELSEGMILSAGDDSNLKVVEINNEIAEGLSIA